MVNQIKEKKHCIIMVAISTSSHNHSIIYYVTTCFCVSFFMRHKPKNNYIIVILDRKFAEARILRNDS